MGYNGNYYYGGNWRWRGEERLGRGEMMEKFGWLLLGFVYKVYDLSFEVYLINIDKNLVMEYAH
jgi:hypothetical protein